MSKTSVPQAIKDLVERFQEHIDDYKNGAYKEEQVCAEFILPMFEALGWDIANRQGSSEAYKEVIHHDSIKSGVGTKAPDYCFRVGGVRKFFLEAKKPSISIKDEIHPAYQLRRYAWSAKLPLGILTDFEEFAVYDCRSRPAKGDKASVARIRYLTFDQYIDRWDEIAGVFSKEAILKGSFDKYAEGTKGRRGTAGVDDAFLEEIERWRKLLAQDIAQRNRRLGVQELNFAVQAIIDRIVFLRICEDQGFEGYGQLMALQNGPHAYDRLIELFRHADQRYNSGIFHFDEEKGRPTPADTLTPKLKIDDDVLREIFKNLYYPQSPYEFSVIPTEILGQVYERFLGKVIHLTSTRRAVIEEKPEVRKAGGVYYTPSYIVDYIVKHTVGKLLEGKTPKEAAKLRILDPACGSGSFLIGAYDCLRKWHIDWYTHNAPEKWAKGKQPALWQVRKGEWALTFAEQKRILTDNLYGVDIDPQAVEVTKLSLLLALLEGERQREMFREHALPDLGTNIKCGNSLIGPDYYNRAQITIFSDDDRERINAFDWRTEFVDIIEGGGFDVVIGNPPYRRELDYKHLMDDIARTEFGLKYRSPRMDLWYYFVHRGLEYLKRNGVLSFITNAYWTSGTGAEKLIDVLRNDTHIDELFYLGKLRVFEKVSGQHMILRVSKGKSDKNICIIIADDTKGGDAELCVRGIGPIKAYDKTPKQLFHGSKVDLQFPAGGLISKIEKHPQLCHYGRVRQGIAENPASINRKTNTKHGGRWRVGEGVFALSKNELKGMKLSSKEKSIIRPYYDLCDIGRYRIASDPSLRLIYSTRRTCPNIDKFPNLRKHLSHFRVVMEARRETKNGSNGWWHLHWPREEEIWESSKILAIQMAVRPSFVPTEGPVYVPFSVNVFIPCDENNERLYYICAVLNSKLIWKWYSHVAKRRGVGLEINGNVLARTPIKEIDISCERECAIHQVLVDLVRKMIELHAKHDTARAPNRKTVLHRQIDATDRQIDQLVYELYGLTKEEIRIVEEATADS
ncbi:MAG: DNA methyltransferase [Pseudomonadota bacterium]